MATGNDIGKLLEQKVDKAYSRYYDSAKKNRLLKSVTVALIEQKYQLYRTTQKIADELQPHIAYYAQRAVNSNKIPLQKMSIVSITYSGTTVTVKVETDEHNLVVGDTFTLQGTGSGLTGLDTTGTVAAVSGLNIFTFTNTSVPSGTYTASSLLLDSPKYLSNYWHLLNAKFLFPSLSGTEYFDMVGPAWIQSSNQVFGKPSARFPRCEEAGNMLIIEPVGTTCSQAKVSYVKRVAKWIDVDNTVYDYSTIFNDKMIEHITDVAAKFWAGWAKSEDAFRTQSMIINDNP